MNNASKSRWTNAVLSAALMGTLGGLGTAGCEIHRNPEPSALDPEPIPLDPAMQSRLWEQSSAVYENVSVTSKPTLFLLDSSPGQPDYRYALIETPIFFANLILMPYTAFRTPPWKTIEHRLESIPPSYTGNPPVPPEQQPEQSDLTQPPAPPSDGTPGDLPPTPPAMPDEPAPSDHPLDQPSDTLPRPAGSEPPSEVPDRPARHIAPDGTPTTVPEDRRITPSTQPTMRENSNAPSTQPTFNK